MNSFTPFTQRLDGTVADTAPEVAQHATGATETNYVPDGVDGFMHAEIVDGFGVIVDGEKRDKSTLIASIKDVLSKLPKSGGSSRSARADFLSDVCRIFKLPTTIGTGDPANVESIVQDLENKPDNLGGANGSIVLNHDVSEVVAPKGRDTSGESMSVEDAEEYDEDRGDR